MYFRASMDWRTRLITAGAVLLLLTIPGLLLARPVFGVVVFIVAGTNALVCLVSFLWAPRGYTVASRQIQVHRPVGKAIIPLVSVQSLRRAEPADVKGLRRTFGNGGLFGTHHAWARIAGSAPGPPISSSSRFRTLLTFSVPTIPIGSSRH
jgi:hypothetical protein